MKSASIATHLRCNQRCAFCTFRRETDDRAFIVRDAVEARISAALASGAREIVLTGGEPSMRGDLAELVRHAKRAGAERVVLETNATAIDATRAAALRDAGLDAARVHVSALGEASDALTADPGGFEATVRGLRALDAAVVDVQVQAVVVRSTAAGLSALPAFLAELGLRVLPELRLVVPVDAPDAGELLSYAEATPAIEATAEAARERGVVLRFAPFASPPPCTFRNVVTVAHAFGLTPGGARHGQGVRVEACSRCSVAERCPGFAPEYLRRFGAPDVTPVLEDKLRRRLTLIGSVQEQITRELVARDRFDPSLGTRGEEDVIRVNFHCNQSCRFCFVSTHLPAAEDERITQAIVEAGAVGRRITLSGGEPTLNPSLERYVRLAKSVSDQPVRLQTNAVRLADAELARRLVEAGVEEAFVSLHGSRAEICDAVTGAPGTFAKTVVGLDRLAELRVGLILNFVICGTNAHDLPDYVRFVAERWPAASLNISFVAASTDLVPREREFIPRYTDVLPALGAALDLAHELGVAVIGFESMCGIPLCLVPGREERFFSQAGAAVGMHEDEFLKPESCQRCAWSPKCHGIRRGYAALHGTDELRAVTSA